MDQPDNTAPEMSTSTTTDKVQRALTLKDNITPDVLLLLCIVANVFGWFYIGWSLIVLKHPFSFMDFGSGTAALIAAYGLANKLSPDTTKKE